MHQHEVAQGFGKECQARSTDLSGDPFGDRTHRSNLCDYEERHASVLLGEQANARLAVDANPPTVAVESQAHYQNRAAGG